MKPAILGVTVLPEWAQAEGVEAVLDRLEAAGVNAIATSPYVMERTPEGEGGREPPIDGGAGSVRLLDRELWGKREVWMRTSPSYAADRSLYKGLRYQPAEADELTRREGATVGRFIERAKARGFEVWMQVQAAIPPGYRVQFGGAADEDKPLLPDGSVMPRSVDGNASLAAPEILAYGCALLKDLAAAYPAVDGFRVDWPEYPPYAYESLFLDFHPEALAFAAKLGMDGEAMRRDTAALQAHLTSGLTDRDLVAPGLSLGRLLTRYPGYMDMLRLKAELALNCVRTYREALPAEFKLVPQSFPAPWSLISGFDHGLIGPLVQGIGVKCYTMHWPMMLRFYADAIKAGHEAAGRKLDEAALARALVQLLDTGADEPGGIEDLRYPEPDENHPVSDAAQAAKITAARAEAGDCPVFAFGHAYGPEDDVIRRLKAVRAVSPDGLWINRYGYLSNGKLDRLKEVIAAG